MFCHLLVLAQLGIIPHVQSVPLSAIPTELSRLDPCGVLDHVTVFISGKAPYDPFFFSVAKVQGTLVLADTLTSQFGQALAQASSDAGEVSANPGEWPDVIQKVTESSSTTPGDRELLKVRGERLKLIVGPLADVVDQLPTLTSQAAALTSSAPGAFSGLRGKILRAAVLRSLVSSGAQLTDAGKNAGRTLANVRAIVAGLPD